MSTKDALLQHGAYLRSLGHGKNGLKMLSSQKQWLQLWDDGVVGTVQLEAGAGKEGDKLMEDVHSDGGSRAGASEHGGDHDALVLVQICHILEI